MAKVPVNWGATDGVPVKLFVIFNTAHRPLYVLARDRRTAMSVAYTANHIYDPTPKIAETYGRHVDEVKSPHSKELEFHWTAIERAKAKRLEGTVHFTNGRASVGDEPI